jgi:SMP-30/Gluconolactonase/LRE-like region
MVVDGRGNAYIGNLGFDFPDGEYAPGIPALISPDGSARQVADGVAFPNGMAVTPDNQTLILAESYANRLTAFDIAADGGLSNRRIWPTWAAPSPTASASTPTVPSGTGTSPTSAACASAKAGRCYRRSSLTGAASPAPSGVSTGPRCSCWRPSSRRPAWPARGHQRARCSPPRHPRRASAGHRSRVHRRAAAAGRHPSELSLGSKESISCAGRPRRGWCGAGCCQGWSVSGRADREGQLYPRNQPTRSWGIRAQSKVTTHTSVCQPGMRRLRGGGPG